MIYEESRGRPDEIHLGTAFGVMRSLFPDGQVFRDTLAAAKVIAAQRVATLRQECQAEPERAQVITHAGRPLHVATALIRAIVVDEARSYRWTANDAVDAAHAMMR